ncbi:MAG: class I SAM-dependent DNA methyltransferase, partial [Nitrospirae bacterium]|nr:class I SAM-dependent DNA methyltransferase [Nitrospirota bacterium]
PVFTRRSRQAIINSGELDWSAINPDIFGSMFQAVISPEQRGGLGMHYTSVPNIMKVIEPLFMNELYEEFEAAKGNSKKLYALLQRIQNIKIFDPACGSGNFLIISYKQLRRLEMKIFKTMNSFAFSNISLSNFYGIELDDFAHEIAILSLWLAEHQMNQEFLKEFGRTKPALPLKETGNIAHGNACRIDWENVCPKKDGDEIYILGNPPYLGFNERSKEQKADMDFALNNIGNIQRLDYIGCWFVKATDYIQDINSRYAFVSTNSICQGEQVSLLWPHIFSKKQEICFAFQPFKWTNNAKGNAGVTCVILGIQNENLSNKLIFSEGRSKIVKSISPYLIEGNPVIMTQRKSPLSNFPEMILGSSGIDGGNLILSSDEKAAFIKSNPNSGKFIKSFIGGGDFVDGTERFCIWVDDNEIKEALKIESIKDRVDKCREYRLGAGRDAKKAANVPHRFFYRKHKDKDAIILPMTSSEKRTYLPVGFLTNRAIVSNGVFVVYDAEPYMMGLIASKMHMCWTQAVSGKLESRIRYSVNLAYNSFPFPEISEEQKQHITYAVLRVLEARERHSEKTLAQLYDPDKMPQGLMEAHHQLDLAVERCYRSKPFESDEERLEYLFKLYEQMIAERNGDLIFDQTKAKRKRK